MRWMTSEVTIGKYIFRHINKCVIEQDRHELTQRCEIRLPNLAGIIGLEDAIKSGDPVVVRLGYDGDLKEEFTGFVARVSPGRPVVVECEDEMWQHKRQPINKSWESITVEDLIKELVPGQQYNVQEVVLSNFIIKQATVAKALRKVKEEYGLDIYYRKGVLYAGIPYGEPDVPEATYHFQKNAIDSDLTYQRAEDVSLKIKAISIKKDNTKLEVEVGDPDGEVHTLHFYNLEKQELIAVAESKIKDMTYTGFTGSFMGFGIPQPQFGGVCHLFDDRYNRSGSYFIEKVKTEYGTGGFHRKVTIGRTAA